MPIGQELVMVYTKGSQSDIEQVWGRSLNIRKPSMKIQKQSGLSLIGFIFVLALVIFVSYLGMRIVPLYLEYYSVVNAMDGVAAERGSAQLSPFDIRVKILNRLYVSYSENVKESHIKLTRTSAGANLRIAYEVRTPVLGNLDVIAKFDRSVKLAN